MNDTNDTRQPQNITTNLSAGKSLSHSESPVATYQERPFYKKRIFTIALLVIIVAVAAGILYWFSIRNEPRTDSANKPAAARPYQQIVADPAFAIEGEHITTNEVAAIGGQAEDGMLLYDFAPYQVSGTNFYTLPKTGDGKAVAVSDVESRYSAVAKSFQGKGFKLLSDDTTMAGGLTLHPSATIAAYAVYASDQTVCSLSQLVLKSAQDARLIGMGCADITSYKEASVIATPFYTAYVKSHPDSTQNKLVIGSPDIQKGKNGKNRAVVFQKDMKEPSNTGVHLYYTATDGDSWIFLASAPSGLLDCSAFSSTELKAAFAGSRCTSGSKTIAVE